MLDGESAGQINQGGFGSGIRAGSRLAAMPYPAGHLDHLPASPLKKMNTGSPRQAERSVPVGGEDVAEGPFKLGLGASGEVELLVDARIVDQPVQRSVGKHLVHQSVGAGRVGKVRRIHPGALRPQLGGRLVQLGRFARPVQGYLPPIQRQFPGGCAPYSPR